MTTAMATAMATVMATHRTKEWRGEARRGRETAIGGNGCSGGRGGSGESGESGGSAGPGGRRRGTGSPPRRALALLLVLLTAPAVAPPAPAGAQAPVIDAAHILVNQYWHYVHYVQFALQIYQQYQALTNQARQIDNQLVALHKLSNPNWREVYDLLANLDWIMRQGRALAYSYHDVDAQFQQVFPGWVEVQDWPAQQKLQAVRTLDTLRTALDTASEQFRHDIADQLFLERMKSQMAGIHGHQEALELQATIALYTAQELGVVKQSLATANNLQAVYYGHLINREAQGEATLAAGLGRTLGSNSQAAAPGYGALPSWWSGGER